MRKLFLLLFLCVPVFGQDLDIAVRPDAIHVESMNGNIVPMERAFFHIVLHNTSTTPMELDWLRFDIVNSAGVLFSGQ